jgi:hypothetical protein
MAEKRQFRASTTSHSVTSTPFLTCKKRSVHGLTGRENRGCLVESMSGNGMTSGSAKSAGDFDLGVHRLCCVKGHEHDL